MLNCSQFSARPTFQRLQAAMREFDLHRMNINSSRQANPPIASTFCGSNSHNTVNLTTGNWREAGDELRRLRSRVVVTIERMLRSHQPHDVLTQVPENTDWQSKTFVLALKIERLMFLAAPSRENYLDEHTLRSRVQLLSRHLVRIRKRKNVMATLVA